MRLRKDEKIEKLAKVPLFSGCPKKHLRHIATITDEIDLRRGTVLTRQGGRGREFFVLLEGTVDVVKDGKQVNTLGAGDFFGEMALISQKPRTATVTAATPIRTLVVTERDFKRLLRDEPDIGVKVLEAVAERTSPADSD